MRALGAAVLSARIVESESVAEGRREARCINPDGISDKRWSGQAVSLAVLFEFSGRFETIIGGHGWRPLHRIDEE